VERSLKAGQNPQWIVTLVEREEEEGEKEEGVKMKMKVRNWREKCKESRLWNKILKRVKTLQGF
jgi:hypothetical protein